MVMLYWMYKTA